jgi:hypothetical protein
MQSVHRKYSNLQQVLKQDILCIDPINTIRCSLVKTNAGIKEKSAVATSRGKHLSEFPDV